MIIVFPRSGYEQSGKADISTGFLPCALLGMSYWGNWESWGSLQGETVEACGGRNADLIFIISIANWPQISWDLLMRPFLITLAKHDRLVMH